MSSKKTRASRPAASGGAGSVRPGGRSRGTAARAFTHAVSRPGGSRRPTLREQLAEPVEPRRRAEPGTIGKAVVLCVMLSIMLVLVMPALRSYLEQRGEIADLKQQKAAAAKSVERLEAQKKQWDDPAYVKKQASERLGYAMPGQKVTVYIDRNNKAHSVSDSAKATSPLRNHPWYGQVWGSISTKTNIEK